MPLTVGWLVAFVVLLVIEFMTIGLVSIWFAVGALLAFAVSLFVDSFIIQLVVFIIMSILALIITKPLVKKFNSGNIVPTNSDRVIGKSGEVTKKIDKNQYGEVKIFGNIWTAYSDEVIDIGERIKVLKIDGVKLIVQKEEK